LDADAILDAARRTRRVVTLEEHSLLGGLGSAVAEVLCEGDVRNVRFQRIALPSEFSKHVGEQEYLRKLYGLDVDSVVQSVYRLWKNDLHVVKDDRVDRGTVDRVLPIARSA
jgi:transketolase C-terminal domain/subunit